MAYMKPRDELIVINPGSTSTKIALFHGEEKQWVENISHPAEQLAIFPSVIDQLPYRLDILRRIIKERELPMQQLSAIVGRGGLLRPIPGGVYEIDDTMLWELRQEQHGKHASNLGALLAHELGKPYGIAAYIVDPICVDELDPVARVSGLPEIERRSVFHALNHKRQARRAAAELGKRVEEVNLIVVHMGGGISIGAHRMGRVVDVTNAVDGEGTFSPERSGALPAADVANLAFSGHYSKEDLLRRINGKGGFVAYLGTNSALEVEEMAANDPVADLLVSALCYQTAKEIGSCAAVLGGQVDAVVLTGGMAHSQRIVRELRDMAGFIAPMLVYPGEDEMAALAEGVIRVLNGEEQVRSYRHEGGGYGKTIFEYVRQAAPNQRAAYG